MELQLANVLEYLNSVGVTDVCQSCQSKAWYFNGYGGETQYMGLPLTSSPDESGYTFSTVAGYHRPMVVMTCQKCGFVRLYDRIMITNWVTSMRQMGNAAIKDPPEGELL